MKNGRRVSSRPQGIYDSLAETYRTLGNNANRRQSVVKSQGGLDLSWAADGRLVSWNVGKGNSLRGSWGGWFQAERTVGRMRRFLERGGSRGQLQV